MFSFFPVERLSIPRTSSPCAKTARANDDPIKPAMPVMRYVHISHHRIGQKMALQLGSSDDDYNK